MKVSKKALRAALAAKGVGEEAIEAILVCLLDPAPAQTFDFGSGLVPAHRHANPAGDVQGGWVADTATVSPTAFIGPDARVYDKAQVYGDARVCDGVHT